MRQKLILLTLLSLLNSSIYSWFHIWNNSDVLMKIRGVADKLPPKPRKMNMAQKNQEKLQQRIRASAFVPEVKENKITYPVETVSGQPWPLNKKRVPFIESNHGKTMNFLQPIKQLVFIVGGSRYRDNGKKFYLTEKIYSYRNKYLEIKVIKNKTNRIVEIKARSYFWPFKGRWFTLPNFPQTKKEKK